MKNNSRFGARVDRQSDERVASPDLWNLSRNKALVFASSGALVDPVCAGGVHGGAGSRSVVGGGDSDEVAPLSEHRVRGSGEHSLANVGGSLLVDTPGT